MMRIENKTTNNSPFRCLACVFGTGLVILLDVSLICSIIGRFKCGDKFGVFVLHTKGDENGGEVSQLSWMYWRWSIKVNRIQWIQAEVPTTCGPV